MPVSAIFFDLDGTLLNTLEDLARCMNSVLEGFGYPSHPVQAYRQLLGQGMQNLVRQALPESARTKDLTQACLLDMQRLYAQNWARKTHLYPGIWPMLISLKQHGLSLNVLSNKPQASTNQVVAHFFSSDLFDFVYGALEPWPKKPDPGRLLRLTDLLKVKPKDCILVGDTGIDMQTAQAAGISGIGVLWGYRQGPELIASGANKLITRPAELLALLGLSG
jgi:phosphoglycolate phosphatase